LPSPRRGMRRQPNGPEFDVRAALFALLGKDLTQINGFGPYLATHCAYGEHDDRVDGADRSLWGRLEGKSKIDCMVCLDQSGNTYRRQC